MPSTVEFGSTPPLAEGQVELGLLPPFVNFVNPAVVEQEEMGLVPYRYVTEGDGLGVWMYVSFARLPKRAKCGKCGERRILYVVKMGEIATSGGHCAKCAKIR